MATRRQPRVVVPKEARTDQAEAQVVSEAVQTTAEAATEAPAPPAPATVQVETTMSRLIREAHEENGKEAPPPVVEERPAVERSQAASAPSSTPAPGITLPALASRVTRIEDAYRKILEGLSRRVTTLETPFKEMGNDIAELQRQFGELNDEVGDLTAQIEKGYSLAPVLTEALAVLREIRDSLKVQTQVTPAQSVAVPHASDPASALAVPSPPPSVTGKPLWG